MAQRKRVVAALLLLTVAALACNGDARNISPPVENDTASRTAKSVTRMSIYGSNAVWPLHELGYPAFMSDAALGFAAREQVEAVKFYRENRFVILSFAVFKNIDYGFAFFGGNWGRGVFLNGNETVMELPLPSFVEVLGQNLYDEIDAATRAALQTPPLLFDAGLYLEGSRTVGESIEEVIIHLPVSLAHAGQTDVTVRIGYRFGPDGGYRGWNYLSLCRNVTGGYLELQRTQLLPCPSSKWMGAPRQP